MFEIDVALMIEIGIDEGNPLLSQELILKRSPKSFPLPESQKGSRHHVFKSGNSHPGRHSSKKFPVRPGDGSRHGYGVRTAHHCEWLYVPHMDP
ncbi:MAG: hypothetical protein JW395_2421 [Nitrospira sp.]|nr:hypothetical protein [Nitrospira sp.]